MNVGKLTEPSVASVEHECQSHDSSQVEITREAIVYMGPLKFWDESYGSAASVVTRLAEACDCQSRTAGAEWTIEWHGGHGETNSTQPTVDRVATLYRRDGSVSAPVFDIYEYTWRRQLEETWRGYGRMRRLMSLFFTLADFPTFLRFIKQRPAMPIGRSRMQLVLALFFVSTVVAYAGLLGFAAWQALGPSGQILTADASGVTVTVQQWIVLGLTFIGLSFDSVRAAASNYGAGLSAVHAYLRGTSNNANRLRGPLQHKLDEMRGDDSVDSVTLIAYSFGAIVAIDNLFPITAPPAHSYEKVKNLVTIGAAYDFVIAARSNYFDGRKAALGVPDRWLNFFAPIDLLGSDFTTPIQATVSELGSAIQVDHSTDAKAQEQAVKEIRPSNYRYDTGVELTWRRVIELYGFSAHRAYWDHDWDNDTNVFTWAVW